MILAWLEYLYFWWLWWIIVEAKRTIRVYNHLVQSWIIITCYYAAYMTWPDWMVSQHYSIFARMLFDIRFEVEYFDRQPSHICFAYHLLDPTAPKFGVHQNGEISRRAHNTAIKGEGVWNCSMKFMTNPNHIILTGSRWGHGSGVQEEHQSSCCRQSCQYQRCHLLALRSFHSQGELLCHDQIGPQPCNFSGNT